MAYKISGSTTHNGRAHVIKNGVYIGYKDVVAGSYDLVFDAENNAGVMTVAEKTDGETVGYGGMTASSTGDSVNLLNPSSGMTIKSIQSGEITYGAVWSATTTINAVDMSKTILYHAGSRCSDYDFSTANLVTLQLINSTTVESKKGQDVGTTNVKFFVVEYESGINVQRGYYTMSNGVYSNSITINAVNVANSFVHATGFTGNPGEKIATPVLYLSDSTTLVIERYVGTSSTSWIRVPWEVVEFL